MSILKQHTTGFPVFCVTAAGNNNEFLIGGGGGATKAGVKNSVILFRVDSMTLELLPVSEYLFSKQDDGCMSIASHPLKRVFIAGVNGPLMEKGENQNARFFYIQNSSIKFAPEKSVQSVTSIDPMHYQKVIRFSKDGKIFVAGTSDGRVLLCNVAFVLELA
jgi:prolactin regulatory element-binding protein